MFRTRIVAFLAALVLMTGAAVPTLAAEVESGSVYCFSAGDFSPEEPVKGICLTDLPESNLGCLMLGSRVLRPGDILTADQLAMMTFAPLSTEEDLAAQVSYLPIYDDRVESSHTVTIAIRGREDKAPVAEDSAHETYKNLPLTGNLKASEPEGQSMTFSLLRSPRRGQVSLNPDGSFTYTPKKNKVGTDSFTYTATDPAGNVSREATVTVQILKPTDAAQYQDTVGRDCRFAAEWMKNTGIFVGEQVVGNPCFSPDKAVTRGEFLTMLVNALQIPLEDAPALTGYTDEVPLWLRPYLAAAVRSGLTAGLPDAGTIGAEQPITGGEAAVMLHNALDLAATQPASATEEEPAVPVWAADAMAALECHGISLSAESVLTREQAALCLYRAVQLAPSAPGMRIIRGQ